MHIDKTQLRKVLYAKRQAIVENHADVVNRLQEAIGLWLSQTQYRCAGFYRSFRHEPDITQVLIAWAKDSDKALAVPRVDDPDSGTMHFCLWSEEMPMVKGAFGIEEPQNDTVVYPDVIFSPCVGVNRQGFRLGNGGGFFDRYLLQRRLMYRPVTTVAVALDELVLEQSYQQAHDIAFDWIVTQSGFQSTKSR